MSIKVLWFRTADFSIIVSFCIAGIVDSKLPTVGVFAKATPADTPKAVVTKTDEAVRSISEEKAAKVQLIHVRLWYYL